MDSSLLGVTPIEQLRPHIERVRADADVREGLAAKDRIVVNGLQRVMPNMQIDPQMVDMASAEQIASLRKEQQLLDETSTALTAKADDAAATVNAGKTPGRG